MASAPDQAPDYDRRLEVSDPSEYNETRRLRQIHKARERVEEAILEGFEDVADSIRDPENYAEYVAECLLLYLLQVEPLLTSSTVLGEIVDDPRSEEVIVNRRHLVDFWYRAQIEPLLASSEALGELILERPDQDETADGRLVEGRRDEADFWDTITIEIEDHGPVTLEEILEEDAIFDDRVISVSESRKAYRLINRFLNEIGFGLQFDEGLPEDEL